MARLPLLSRSCNPLKLPSDFTRHHETALRRLRAYVNPQDYAPLSHLMNTDPILSFADADLVTGIERLEQWTPHKGPLFEEDNIRAFNIYIKSIEGTPTYSLLGQDDIDNKNFKGVWTTVQSLYDTEENKAQHLEQANHIVYTANLTDKSPVPPRTFIALTQEAHRRIEKITGNSLADITKLQYFFKRVQGCSYWKDTINFIRKDATLKKSWKEATQLLLENIPWKTFQTSATLAMLRTCVLSQFPKPIVILLILNLLPLACRMVSNKRNRQQLNVKSGRTNA